MKEIKIKGLQKGDKLFKTPRSGPYIKIRIVNIAGDGMLQDAGVLAAIRISGSITDNKGRAKRRAGVSDEYVQKMKDDGYSTASLHLVNQPHVVTIQKSADPDFDPGAEIEKAIKAHIEDTAQMEKHIQSMDEFLKEWG